jgi:hypothetical protein
MITRDLEQGEPGSHAAKSRRALLAWGGGIAGSYIRVCRQKDIKEREQTQSSFDEREGKKTRIELPLTG